MLLPNILLYRCYHLYPNDKKPADVHSAFSGANLKIFADFSYICAMKHCSNCKQLKELSEFYKKRQSKDGHDFWCKKCWKGKRKFEKTYADKSQHFTGNQLHSLINNSRKRANIKNLPFTITTKEIALLVHQFCEKHQYSWLPKHPFKPSIDRIDSSKGYTIDNIQIIWLIENYCKNTFTNEQVLEFCKAKLALNQGL